MYESSEIIEAVGWERENIRAEFMASGSTFGEPHSIDLIDHGLAARTNEDSSLLASFVNRYR